MRALKQVVNAIQEIKLGDKFAKKQSILVAKLNKYLKQSDFFYKESFYIQQAANDIKSTIHTVRQEFEEEESKEFVLILTHHLNQLKKWNDDAYHYSAACEALALYSMSPLRDQKEFEPSNEKKQEQKLDNIWTKLLVNPSGTLFPQEEPNGPVIRSNYSLTERCFNLGMLFSKYTLTQLDEYKAGLSNEFPFLCWLLLASDRWLKNAPLLGIYLLQVGAEGRSMASMLQRWITPHDGIIPWQLKMQVIQFCKEKNIRLEDITSQQICELFNLKEVDFMLSSKEFLVDYLPPHITKDCTNIVIGYYDEKIRFFKPCDKPRSELSPTRSCVIS